jgi:hypothetical protein
MILEVCTTEVIQKSREYADRFAVGNKWDFARLAMQICVEKGYHKHVKFPIDRMTEQMRRRMFWCSYVSERHSCSFLGRPVMLSDNDITVEVGIQNITRTSLSLINVASIRS